MKHITANTHINDIGRILTGHLRQAEAVGIWDSESAHQQGIHCMASINGGEIQTAFTIPKGARMLNGEQAHALGINAGICQGIQATIQNLQQRFGGKVKARIMMITQPRIYLCIDHEVKQPA
jgi:hypothetical protein